MTVTILVTVTTSATSRYKEISDGEKREKERIRGEGSSPDTAPTSTPTWCPIGTVFVKLQLKLGHKVDICKLDSGALLDASTLVS
jgi:hypothetical protein